MSTRNASSDTDRFLPWLVAVAFFMQFLDATILNTALPAMAVDLGESPLQMQAVVVAYLLTLALLIPTSGWLADRFGTRNVFHLAIVLFCSGSLLCALSSEFQQLILFRVVQGAGGALLMPVGRLVLLKIFPAREIVRVLSFVSLPGMLGPLLGPVLGGWLVEVASWHWIFLINIPIGVAGLVLSSRWMPNIRGDRSRFDVRGFVLFSGGIVLVSFALQVPGRIAGPAVPMLSLTAGLLFLGSYWWHASHAPHPLFSLPLLRLPALHLALKGCFLARMGSAAMPFLTPIFLQVGLGYSPSAAGTAMIPTALGAMVSKAFIERLIRRIGYRRILVVNTMLLGGVIAGFALVDRGTSLAWILLHLCLFGIVNALQFTALSTLTLISLGASHASSGNSLFSVVVQLSMGTSVALAGTLLGVLGGSGSESLSTDLVATFHITYLLIGSATALASLVFLRIPFDEGILKPGCRQ